MALRPDTYWTEVELDLLRTFRNKSIIGGLEQILQRTWAEIAICMNQVSKRRNYTEKACQSAWTAHIAPYYRTAGGIEIAEEELEALKASSGSQVLDGVGRARDHSSKQLDDDELFGSFVNAEQLTEEQQL
jgi:hypothetical protein